MSYTVTTMSRSDLLNSTCLLWEQDAQDGIEYPLTAMLKKVCYYHPVDRHLLWPYFQEMLDSIYS